MKTFKIYGLFDLTGCRYIGKTSVSLEERLRGSGGHLYEKAHTYKGCWIRKLRSQGFEPEIRLLEITDEANWRWRERVWISWGKHLGWKLTNLTDGGDGLCGYTASAETRRKLSIASMGRKHTQDAIEKISLKHRGKTLSQSHCENMSKVRLGKSRPEFYKPVQKLKDGIIVEEYKSLQDASRINNLHTDSIRRCCRGLRKECFGFKWRYKL